ncbi:MAG: biotin/lipoyl-binding protein [Chloroflexi bacterium]|nr:biotin/lipoyl-binding protein [Chloroflexota bacterium]
MKVIVNDKAYSVEAQGETVTVEGRPFKVRVEGGQPLATVTVDGRVYKLEAQPRKADPAGPAYSVLVDGKAYRVAVEGAVAPAPLARPSPLGAPRPAAPAPAARLAPAPAPAEAAAPGAVTALMPGRVVAMRVQQGDTVESGQVLLILEAMKMENEIRAPKAGLVKTVPVSVGSNVNKGDILAIVE